MHVKSHIKNKAPKETEFVGRAKTVLCSHEIYLKN
jgi:hypothetical protein